MPVAWIALGQALGETVGGVITTSMQAKASKYQTDAEKIKASANKSLSQAAIVIVAIVAVVYLIVKKRR